MKTFLARLVALCVGVVSLSAQPTIPVSNISPVTGNSVIGRSVGTGRAQSIPLGTGLSIVGGELVVTGGGGGGAPTNATYITQTPNATLTNEQALSLLSTGIVYVTTTTGVLTSLGPILPGGFGGTNNAFTQFTGPASAMKTFTLPNASATILTTNAAVTVAQGGTGQTTYTNGQLLIGNTTSGGLDKASLTAGGNITITPSAGGITIAATAGGSGNVTNNATLTAGNIVLGGGTTVVGTSSLSVTGGINLTVPGNLTVTGNQTVGNLTTTDLTITGSITGVMGAANGGTGQSSYAVGDILYASGATTLSKLADVATGNVILSGGVTTAPSYGKVGLTTHVSGTLPVANGGTSLATLTANSIFIGNGTGTPIQLAPGTSGNVVTSNGTAWTSAAPTAGGTLTLARWTANDGQPPATNYAQFLTRNAFPVLNFDADTDWSTVFSSIIPQGATFSTGISVIIKWTAATATTGDCVWVSAFERVNTDIDSDSFATGVSQTTTTSGTSGVPNTTTINHSGAEIDGVTAGDMVRVQITRDANAGGDTLTGFAQILSVEIQQR